MLLSLLLVAAGTLLFFQILVWPVVQYFRDPKGLRRYPNAHPLSGITNIWYMYISRPGTRSKTLLALFKDQPVLRLGPNHVSFADLRAIKDIHGHGTTCLKGQFYTEVAGSHRHLADVEDRSEHTRKRRMMANAYSAKNVAQWEHKVHDKVLRLLRQFDRRCTPAQAKEAGAVAKEDLTVDYWPWANLFTLDAIADIGLSDRLGLIDRGDDFMDGETVDGGRQFRARLRDSLHDNARLQHWTVWADEGWYSGLKKITSWLPSWYKGGWDGSDHWDGLIQGLARRRLEREQKGEKLDDFFTSMMTDKYGSPNNLEWGEVLAETSIMMNAGSDTTAIAMTNVIYLLHKNPSVLAKLREELATVLTPADVIAEHEKVKRLPYLRACIDECLRLYPPVCFPLPRQTPPEGAAVLGEYLPGGTQVSVPSYVAHRDPTVFADPEAFKPERWLGEEGKKLQSFFIPFAAGARGCIGRNITYLEQHVALATMLHRYEFKLPREGWEMEQYEGFNIWPVALPLKVSRREGIAELPEVI